MCVCVHVYVCLCVHICMCLYVYVNALVCVYLYVYMYLRCIFVPISPTWVYACTRCSAPEGVPTHVAEKGLPAHARFLTRLPSSAHAARRTEGRFEADGQGRPFSRPRTASRRLVPCVNQIICSVFVERDRLWLAERPRLVSNERIQGTSERARGLAGCYLRCIWSNYYHFVIKSHFLNGN